MNERGRQQRVDRVIAGAAASLDTAGVESAQFDAELLLADAFEIDRTRLLARLADSVPAEVTSRFEEMLERRVAREPAAYIRGRKEFMSLEFEVTGAVMIPRPETEALVERALERLGERDDDQTVMDLCTGSGCIGVSLAVYARKCRVCASDIDADALLVARRNAVRAGVYDRMEFFKGDLYAPFDRDSMAGTFDLIVSNPPYVSELEWGRLWPEASTYEPRRALVARDDGFEMVRRVIEGVPTWLRHGGVVLVEMAERMVEDAKRVAEATGLFAEVAALRALGGSLCGMEARLEA
jgi:release factor glutamine methyltransferase